MPISQRIFELVSARVQGRMTIVPSIYVREGELVRPSPFETADTVFTGTPVDVARRFLAATPARIVHIVDVEGRAASPGTFLAAREVAALEGVAVLLEGGLASAEICRRLAALGLVPIADETILSESPEIEVLFDETADVLFGVRGDDDDLFERIARSFERGCWGVVHHSTNPAVSCEVSRRTPNVPFFSREPAASPDDVEAVIEHHKRLYRGGASGAIVDGEWYVDYNTANSPFDLLR